MADSENAPRFNTRPQSMIAQKFSQDLESIFGLDGTFELTQEIEDKKRVVSTRNKELEELEAKLRATEEQLKARKPDFVPSSVSSAKKSDDDSEEDEDEDEDEDEPAAAPPRAQQQTKAGIPFKDISQSRMQQQGKKPAPIEEDSDDEEGEDTEDTEEDDDEEEEDEDSTEESSSEEERK